MVVAIAQLDLHLPESGSLKAKRGILKSLKDRIHNQFNVSVAEVDHHDLWQRALLGVAAVSNDRRYADGLLAQVVRLVESHPAVALIDYKTELIDASL
jgi:uncharacterized protein YlxP (DUF503 family)